jgi:phosphatidylglycerophosphatase A
MKRATSKVAWAIATWFGCGLVPIAPGTAGTLGAIPLFLLASRGGSLAVGAVALAVTGAGVWASTRVAGELGKEDPQVVVVDEVAGTLVTMLPLASVSASGVLLGVALFRFFDVTKPWPIRRLERLPGGWGIVMDDLGAGVLGAAVMGALRLAGALP